MCFWTAARGSTNLIKLDQISAAACCRPKTHLKPSVFTKFYLKQLHINIADVPAPKGASLDEQPDGYSHITEK